MNASSNRHLVWYVGQMLYRLLYLLIGTVLLSCSPNKQPTRASFELSDIDPRSQVIGVVPNDPTDPVRSAGMAVASPTIKTPGVTSAVHTDVSPKQEASKMPLPGQANDHSDLSPVPSQRSVSPATK